MPTTFTLSEFKDSITGNFVRSNRFLVTFSNATTIGLPTNYQYLVKSLPLPTKTNGEIISNWFGMEHKQGGDITIDDLTIVFLLDEGLNMRLAFETWFNSTTNPITNTRGDYGTYKSDIEVQVMGLDNKEISKYQFIGCFPTSVGAVEMDQDTVDSSMDLSVTFSVDDWTKLA